MKKIKIAIVILLTLLIAIGTLLILNLKDNKENKEKIIYEKSEWSGGSKATYTCIRISEDGTLKMMDTFINKISKRELKELKKLIKNIENINLEGNINLNQTTSSNNGIELFDPPAINTTISLNKIIEIEENPNIYNSQEVKDLENFIKEIRKKYIKD